MHYPLAWDSVYDRQKHSAFKLRPMTNMHHCVFDVVWDGEKTKIKQEKLWNEACDHPE